MNTQVKLGLGSALSIVGAISIVLPLLMKWTIPRPWGFLLGLVVGVVTLVGVTLAITGFIERRRGN